jgi:YD repeat-containing protein
VQEPLGHRSLATTAPYDLTAIVREVRGAQTLRYIHGPGTDVPLAVDDGASTSYFHADGLGSIVSVTNAAGTVTMARTYDAWGNLQAGASEPGYAFTD